MSTVFSGGIPTLSMGFETKLTNFSSLFIPFRIGAGRTGGFGRWAVGARAGLAWRYYFVGSNLKDFGWHLDLGSNIGANSSKNGFFASGIKSCSKRGHG